MIKKIPLILINFCFLVYSCNSQCDCKNEDFKKAQALYKKKDYDNALRAINNYVHFFPECDTGYYFKALIIEYQLPLDLYQEGHDKEKAIEALNKAISLNPNYKEAYYERAQIELYYFALYNGFINVWRDVNKALEIDPDYVDALIFRAAQRNSSQRGLNKDSLYTESLKDLDHVIKIDPKNCYAFFYRGNMNYYLDKKTEACQDWQTARDLGCRVDAVGIVGECDD